MVDTTFCDIRLSTTNQIMIFIADFNSELCLGSIPIKRNALGGDSFGNTIGAIKQLRIKSA